jgi:hypothetical protein
VKENMETLCNKYFPNEYAALKNSLIGQPLRANPGLRRVLTYPEKVEEEEGDDKDNKLSNQYGLDIDGQWDDHATLVVEDRRGLNGTLVAS